MNRAAAMAAAGLSLMPLAALAQDAFVTRADGNRVVEDTSRLGIELIWGVGDRGSTVTLHLGMGKYDVGFVKVSEVSRGGVVLTEGYTELGSKDAARLIDLSKSADFQSFPATVPEHPFTSAGPNGVEAIFLCRSDLTLSETRVGEKKTVQRGCPRDKADPAIGYAKALIRFAQGHFPDLAKIGFLDF